MIQKEFFLNLEKHHKSQLPFVAFRKPNDSCVKAILQEDKAIHTVTDFTESGFVFSPFDSKKDTILFPLEHSKTMSYSLPLSSEISKTSNFEPEIKSFDSSKDNRENHLKLVDSGIKAIQNGRFEKVVLSRVEDVPISEENPIKTFQTLLKNYTTAYVYLWYHPEIGLWLGATPETLLHLEGQRLKTMSLAGTQPYKGEMDVVWDEKNTVEQHLVTNFVLQSLQPLVDQLKATNAKTIKAGQLLHLQSRIDGVLKSKNLKPIIEALHPTPAVCGLPKTVAKDFILEHEHYNREFYTGFLGELNIKTSKIRNTNRRNVENNAYNLVKTSSALFVNLRCMQIKDDRILIYVGGGVTKQSTPEKEWEETVSKTRTMMQVIA
ncbi:chorismate-binding protein [Psychroserpens damuponensis]|uniref:chorismate-binding protein n=1 Tax=Psychroserpens damuponensis TaxID=943936 RepID=UPI00058FB4E1|nr:chorismate-binding protein [Psychroserpens damuponensis]